MTWLYIPHESLPSSPAGGGLSLGLKRAVGGLRTVCHVEREAYAAAVLVARMVDTSLDQAPVWDDVVTFDGSFWRGRVDLVAGGFPCQDISNAGKRAGIDGERSGLWREFARIIGEVEPEFVFIENVAALVRRGLDRVLGDLAALGFDAEWGVFRASDAGAPHKRARLFILAHSPREGIGRLREPQRGSVGHVDGSRAEAMAHAECPELRDESGRGGGSNRAGESVAANAGEPLEHSNEWPPGPEDRNGWAQVLAEAPKLEPAVCRMAHGLANRVDRLRVLGNGVVPAQAALAYRELHRRMFGGCLNDSSP